MSRAHLEDIKVVKHHETDGAILVSETGKRFEAVWLPKAAIEYTHTGKTVVEELEGPSRFQPKICSVVEVTGPQSLFEERGLV